MRLFNVLGAAVAAVAIGGAVVGSAAAITNTVPTLGGDSASVAACDTTVTTSWDTAYDASIPGYKVTDVTIGGIDGAACVGATLKVTLTGASGVSFGEKTATILIADTSKVVDYSDDDVSAEGATGVSVVLVGA